MAFVNIIIIIIIIINIMTVVSSNTLIIYSRFLTNPDPFAILNCGIPMKIRSFCLF